MKIHIHIHIDIENHFKMKTFKTDQKIGDETILLFAVLCLVKISYQSANIMMATHMKSCSIDNTEISTSASRAQRSWWTRPSLKTVTKYS